MSSSIHYHAGFRPCRLSSCCVCGLKSEGLWCTTCLAPLIEAGEAFVPSITVKLASPEANAYCGLQRRKGWRSTWSTPKVLTKQLKARSRLMAEVAQSRAIQEAYNV